ncbi:S1 family peptidase [Nocardia lijiangensis]|uniref:S1 family peptidase n=1 Tax=Nocardia lijiangensis TaxID=299618 RepID=UPI000B1FB196|nr:S1 family peptidase [Nocardia lijiangensis]
MNPAALQRIRPTATRPARARAVLAALAAVLIATLSPGHASAAEPAVLGGGSGIVLGMNAACTLTTIGYDNAGRLVGLTAGHCTQPGIPVRAEHAPWVGPIGTVVLVDRYDDYAVIEFDRERVVPLRNVGATVIADVGGPPAPGTIVCKNGRTSGHGCGVVWDQHEWWFRNQVCSQPGDSGGPVTVGDRLVGMNIGHAGVAAFGVTVFDVACQHPQVAVHDPAVATQIGKVLHDIDRAGGPGAGFEPF